MNSIDEELDHLEEVVEAYKFLASNAKDDETKKAILTISKDFIDDLELRSYSDRKHCSRSYEDTDEWFLWDRRANRQVWALDDLMEALKEMDSTFDRKIQKW